MIPVPSPEVLVEALASTRAAAAAYHTNLFLNLDQIAGWFAEGGLAWMRGPGAVLVRQREAGLDRLFHAATCPGALAEALARLPEPPRTQPWVSDLVGRPEALTDVAGIYAACGFRHHRSLLRMIRVGTPLPAPPDPSVCDEALPGQADAVVAMLRRLLDPLAERIPSPREVARWAADGEMLTVRRGDTLAGMLAYHVQGRSAHLRYWHVDPRFRGGGAGSALLRTFLDRTRGCTRQTLWVLAHNADSIAKYAHYGFHMDPAVDMIMVKGAAGPGGIA
ncbi:GNAT family N-acetyltransferase [Mesoterricola sediminis]|uniref:N-acetyltransferase domain-containing protein n=1 Tax=Mesoterricola sediminis TaxID=2927980 RepID=A0AA48KDX8_9BACT|nr:GNAT family N-acetyltransferase [Mesoterricola sediminis]BDU78681.1 hypothetical protein METESE_36390 [Mesoterricola sediminis]